MLNTNSPILSRLEKSQLSEVLDIAIEQRSDWFNWTEIELSQAFEFYEVWGISKNAKLIGFLIVADRGIAWELLAIAIKNEYQKQGRGREFLNSLIDAKQYKSIWWLEVHEQNLSAQKLYLKCGFSSEGVRPSYYKDGGDAIVMTKTS